ncbi:MAG: alpha/beta hydrolase family protein [Patescibacteria group bacterium]
MKKIRTYRTRFNKDIVSEWLLPIRPSNKVIILCDGLPVIPCKNDLMMTWSKQGYWVFYPRYRGSWESGGWLLGQSPHLDILEVVSGLFSGFKDLATGKKYSIDNPRIFLLGGSFGGPAVILASRDKRVAAGVAISPVVDWRAPSPQEPLSEQYDWLKIAYGFGYRLKKIDWNKLKTGNFYNPIKHINSIVGSKLMIIHSQHDKIVRYKEVKIFSKQVGAKFYNLKTGGHLSMRLSVKTIWLKRIKSFYKNFS